MRTPDQLIHRLPIADTHVDRYMKWLPAIVALASGPLALHTRHSTPQQCALLGLNTALVKAATQGLKSGVHRNRPLFPLDGQSFPSSHSSTAFAGAEFLRREWQQHYPALSWAGYIPAVATGLLRLSKRRHWPSDVLAGALIGIGSVWLAERLFRKIQSKNPDNSDSNFRSG